jgi:hypothetical protein
VVHYERVFLNVLPVMKKVVLAISGRNQRQSDGMDYAACFHGG